MKGIACKIARNHKYDGYQRALASTVYKFFHKKIGFFYKKLGWGVIVNEQLAEKLHKPVIKEFKRRKVRFKKKKNVRFRSNIQAADLA